jgi:hypothetical protein
MAQEEESGPNGPHLREIEGDPAVASSADVAAARDDSDGGDPIGFGQGNAHDGSGPSGPQIEVAATSGPNGPHPKVIRAAAGVEGGATALEDEGSGPNGPH